METHIFPVSVTSIIELLYLCACLPPLAAIISCSAVVMLVRSKKKHKNKNNNFFMNKKTIIAEQTIGDYADLKSWPC